LSHINDDAAQAATIPVAGRLRVRPMKTPVEIDYQGRVENPSIQHTASGLDRLSQNAGTARPEGPIPRWEHFPHDADVGVCGYGRTPAEAFEQAALALTAVVTTAEIKSATMIDIECSAPDLELLFVEWLNSIIYEMAVRRMLFSRFSVVIEGGVLRARLWGEDVDVARHAPACEPKGATYTALKVLIRGDGTWSASCIVDV
jgi:SHS2 domain-containing protein